jgi:hypothetical protein
MPNKYTPLLDGFDNLASALMLAPKMAKANRIADEDRADRKAREERALARALLLEERHNTERAEDRAMRKAEFEEWQRVNKARYPGGEAAGKPLSVAERKYLDDQAEADALAKGLLILDENGKPILATRSMPVIGPDGRPATNWRGSPVMEDQPIDPNEISGLRDSKYISSGINPQNYLPIGEKNPYRIEIPKAEQDADAAFKAKQDALRKSRLRQVAPAATPEPTDLIGNPLAPQDQNLGNELGVTPGKTALKPATEKTVFGPTEIKKWVTAGQTAQGPQRVEMMKKLKR